jgi:hypothetical protein
MRKTILGMVLALPLAALAGPPGPPGRGGPDGPPEDAAARQERMVKRMRLARTLGLAERLDLTEAEALKLRDVMGKYDDRLLAIGKQMREAMETVKKAARGDGAAQKGLDEALKRLRELRGQAQAASDEMLDAVTKGFTPERKAKAALFFRHFRHQMAVHGRELRDRFFMRGQPQGPMRGPMNRGEAGPPGRGMRWGMGSGGPAAPGPDEPDVEILPDDEPI